MSAVGDQIGLEKSKSIKILSLVPNKWCYMNHKVSKYLLTNSWLQMYPLNTEISRSKLFTWTATCSMGAAIFIMNIKQYNLTGNRPIRRKWLQEHPQTCQICQAVLQGNIAWIYIISVVQYHSPFIHKLWAFQQPVYLRLHFLPTSLNLQLHSHKNNTFSSNVTKSFLFHQSLSTKCHYTPSH